MAKRMRVDFTPTYQPPNHNPITLEELKVTDFFQECKQRLTVRCIETYLHGYILEMALEDETGVMLALAYDGRAYRMGLGIKAGDWYILKNFRVRKEKSDDVMDHVNKLMIVVEPITRIDQDETKAGKVPPKIKSIDEINSLAEGTIVDVRTTFVKHCKEVKEEVGKEKCDGNVFLLTDAFEKTILLSVIKMEGDRDTSFKLKTLYENTWKMLLETKNQPVIIRRAVVSTFESDKCLEFKWFSEVEAAEDEDT